MLLFFLEMFLFIMILIIIIGIIILIIIIINKIYHYGLSSIVNEFWDARIAWERDKQEYQDYIKSHK